MRPTDRAGALLLPWYALLPSDLLRRAYDHGYGEYAWSRADALAVVALLEARGWRICSVDTWLPTRPGPTPLIDDWPRPGGVSAAAFIASFRDRFAPAGANHEIVFAVDAEPAG